MTEVAVIQSATLALEPDQSYWSPAQLAALTHIGIENAAEGDLQVFHHVCQRTGLDPFARQIYMIGRQLSENINGEWVKVTKQTIQTGIDGFRLIGRRAANSIGHSVALAAPEWAHEDGTWRPIWMNAWGRPVAARVTIKRNGEPFTAVALFDEYKQTKRNGDLTSMWGQRPAGQLAKCAEALAWRMAFPQDLSGLYTDDEMGQADSARGEVITSAPAPAADRMRSILTVEQIPETGGSEGSASGDEPDLPVRGDGEPSESPSPVTPAQVKKIAATMGELGITERDNALLYVNDVIGREVASRNELTKDEASRVIESLERDLAQPFPDADGEARS